MKYLVLNVRCYDFVDDKTGKSVEGASVTYLDLDNEPEAGEKGIAPLTISATTEQVRDFTSVPGLYDMEFKHKRGAGNKVRVVFHSAMLKQAISFPRPSTTSGSAAA